MRNVRVIKTKSRETSKRFEKIKTMLVVIACLAADEIPDLMSQSVWWCNLKCLIYCSCFCFISLKKHTGEK